MKKKLSAKSRLVGVLSLLMLFSCAQSNNNTSYKEIDEASDLYQFLGKTVSSVSTKEGGRVITFKFTDGSAKTIESRKYLMILYE